MEPLKEQTTADRGGKRSNTAQLKSLGENDKIKLFYVIARLRYNSDSWKSLFSSPHKRSFFLLQRFAWAPEPENLIGFNRFWGTRIIIYDGWQKWQSLFFL